MEKLKPCLIKCEWYDKNTGCTKIDVDYENCGATILTLKLDRALKALEFVCTGCECKNDGGCDACKVGQAIAEIKDGNIEDHYAFECMISEQAAEIRTAQKEIEQFERTGDQVERLANFILNEFANEPSRNEGAIDTAIRIIKELQAEIIDSEDE